MEPIPKKTLDVRPRLRIESVAPKYTTSPVTPPPRTPRRALGTKFNSNKVKSVVCGLPFLIFIACVVIFVVGWLIAASLNWVTANTVALDYAMLTGTIDKSQLMLPGRYFFLWHDLIAFPVTVQEIYIESLPIRSQEGVQIQIDILLQYQFSPVNIDTFTSIYYNYETDYSTIISYVLQGAVYTVCSKQYASDFYLDRARVMNDSRTAVILALSELPIVVQQFQIANIFLDENLSDAIIQTSLAIIDQETALEQRNLQQFQLATRQLVTDISIQISYLQASFNITNTLAIANNTASVLSNIFQTEMSGLQKIQQDLNMTQPEFEAFIYLKSLGVDSNQTLSNKMILSIPSNLIN